MRLNNKKELQIRRRELRRNATPQEVILWARLRKSQISCKFRRQHSVGWYIVDFYCPEKRLAIEIDGSQHVENKEYDKMRTEYLNELGITVLRFWDNEVNKNLEGVMLKITTTLNPSFSHHPTSPTRHPSLKRREGKTRDTSSPPLLD